MGIAIAVQLRQFFAFAAAGAVFGLWYDLLRPVRRGAASTALVDVLFAATALLFLFGAGQPAAEGAFYLYMAAGAALGFVLWRRFASRPLRRLLWALWRRVAGSFLGVGAKKVLLWLKKVAISLFSSGAKWVTIALKQSERTHRACGRRQTAYEAAQGKLADAARHRSAADLRRRSHRADAGKAGRGQENAGRARRAGDRA